MKYKIQDACIFTKLHGPFCTVFLVAFYKIPNVFVNESWVVILAI